MQAGLDPFRFLLITLAGWMNQHQQHAIAYLIEENRVLREQIGNRRMRFTDDQRRRLAARAKQLGRKLLAHLATIVTPDTFKWSFSFLTLRECFACLEPFFANEPTTSKLRKFESTFVEAGRQ